MRDMTHIPDFPNIETAAAWAEINQPLKAALTRSNIVDGRYSAYFEKYGKKSVTAALDCWSAIADGADELAIIRAMRQLSWSLPSHVWEDRRR